jgi:hypothetical protein
MTSDREGLEGEGQREGENDLDLVGEELEGPAGSSGTVGFLGGLVLGALVGAGIALLVAPERGSEVRRRLRRRFRKTRDDARRRLRRFKHDMEREAARRRRWVERAARHEEES